MTEMDDANWPTLSRKPKHYTLMEWRIDLSTQIEMIKQSMLNRTPISVICFARSQAGSKRTLIVKKLMEGAKFYANCAFTDEYYRYDLGYTEVVNPDYPVPQYDAGATWPPFGDWDIEGTDRLLESRSIETIRVRFEYCDDAWRLTWRDVDINELWIKEQTVWFAGRSYGGTRGNRGYGTCGVRNLTNRETGEIYENPDEFLLALPNLRNTVDK